MDFGSGIDDRADGPASDEAGPLGCVDEFDDPMSIEDLARRWRCKPKTARAKMMMAGLGINPAGTWLISRQRVRAYEEYLLGQAGSKPKEASITESDNQQAHVRAELSKLGILRPRPRSPDIVAGAATNLRKAG